MMMGKGNHKVLLLQMMVAISSLYLSLLWIFGLNEAFFGGVMVPHDSFYPLTDNLSNTIFSVFTNIGYTNNVVNLFIHIPDLLVIQILKLFFNNQSTQNIHTVICLIVLVCTSYLSIDKLSNNKLLKVAVVFCYCFSPYLSIFLNGGQLYTISTALCIGVMPLFIYKLATIKDLRDVVNIFPILVIFAFGILYFYPAMLLLLTAMIFNWKLLWPQSLSSIYYHARNCRLIIVMCVLALVPFISLIALNSYANETAAFYLQNQGQQNIQGGVFYPLMQISSFGIYSHWHPRSVLTFVQYYFSSPYKILSISIAAAFILYGLKNKFYISLVLLGVAAFFAKGISVPFGEINSFVTENLPLGYLIRTPDTKFGAFISAIYCTLPFFMRSSFIKRLYIAVLVTFLIFNLFGMYSHGVVSPSKGDAETTHFIEDGESYEVLSLINNQKNSVVITNLTQCSGELYKNKFHTCKGIIFSAIKKHVIPADTFKDFLGQINAYIDFPQTLFISKRINNMPNDAANQISLLGFKKIYASDNYEIFIKESHLNSCEDEYVYSCVQEKNEFLLSPPPKYFQYLGVDEVRKRNQYTVMSNLPKNIEETLRLLMIVSYSLVFFLAIFCAARGKG